MNFPLSRVSHHQVDIVEMTRCLDENQELLQTSTAVLADIRQVNEVVRINMAAAASRRPGAEGSVTTRRRSRTQARTLHQMGVPSNTVVMTEDQMKLLETMFHQLTTNNASLQINLRYVAVERDDLLLTQQEANRPLTLSFVSLNGETWYPNFAVYYHSSTIGSIRLQLAALTHIEVNQIALALYVPGGPAEYEDLNDVATPRSLGIVSTSVTFVVFLREPQATFTAGQFQSAVVQAVYDWNRLPTL